MSRPGVAALLSALIPGLGQARLGAGRRGALIALPFIGLLAVGLAAIVLDPKGALNTVVSAGALVGLLVLVLILAVYHLGAIVDAFRLGNRLRQSQDPPLPRRRALGSPLLLLGLAGAVTFYGVLEFVGVRAYQATQAIFVDPGTGYEIPEASFAPSPSPTSAPIPTGIVTAPPPPSPTPVPVPAWAADGRLNLLLMGSDAGPGRWLARTDTMIVLSVDVASGRAALFGIPRNIVNVPLPPESAAAFKGGRFPQFLNALYVYAYHDPKHFPGADGDTRGFRAVTGAIQELVGVPLDGAIVVNLNGFVDLVDAVGGLWVNIPYSLYDAHYPLPNGLGYIEISIPSGCHKLTGERALEYARSRHQDSDYGRMQRQQRVLVALARQLDPISLLSRVPDLLDIAQDNLLVTVPLDEIANLAALAARVDTADIQTIQFSPPTYPEYLNTKSIQRIRDQVATVFDAPAAAPSPTPGTTPKPCPRP
jgi:polyisoprenyl-teichoic acid--peptidoglycan teichoic acid transferase